MSQHFKSEWHRYNLKRKVATLPAVTQEEFERRKTEVLARAAENNLASMSHVKEGKREKVSRKNEKKKQYAEAPPPPPTLAAAGEDGDRPEVEDAQGMEETLESLNLGDVDVSKFEIDLKKSIFDDHDSEESAYNMIYMQKNFGFFLPDAEYLVDPEGLLKYCALKVKAGRTCLYCQKIFASEQAVVNHMVEKAHCKLAYDTEEDVDEFEDFYDFSKTWEEFADDDEGEENWETASDDDEDSSAKAGGAEGASVQDTPDADAESAPSGDAKKKKKPPKITILESGEMLVKDGKKERLIGIREFKQVYKQHFKPDDERAMVVAANKTFQARMLVCYQNAGIPTSGTLSMHVWQNKYLTGKGLKELRQINHARQKYEARRIWSQNLVNKAHIISMGSSMNLEQVGAHG